MKNLQSIYNGISKAAWGYFFIYFDFTFNGVSIFPSFVGYLFFLSAINRLSNEERELNLLKSLTLILISWHTALWISSWVSFNLDGRFPIIDAIICVVNLYFHFQFLTNLASIAAKYQPENASLDKKLLKYRTAQTIMLTVIFILYHWVIAQFESFSAIILIGIIIANAIVCLMLVVAMFALRRCLPIYADGTEENTQNTDSQ